jgi:hypothetical protein
MVILSASLAFAERSNFRNRSENWLKKNSPETTTGNLRSNSNLPTIDDEDEGETPGTPGPVGEGLLLLTVLAGGYIAVKKNKKK